MQQRSKSLLVVALALVMVLAFSAVAQADDYSSHWSASYISNAISRGWISVDANGNIQPDAQATRGEYALMMWKALGQPVPKYACPFTDIPEGANYINAATALFEAGVTNGIGNNKFGGDQYLTREMSFTMLARAYSLTPTNTLTYQNFADYTTISDWARNAISALREKGYIEGVGSNNCAPKQNLKRGEMIKIVMNVANGVAAAQSATAALSQVVAGPSISVKQTALGSDEVKITVTVDSGSSAEYIGWRSSDKDATYKSRDGFQNITTDKDFTVDANGWYAVYAENKSSFGNFKLIEVKSITAGPKVRLTQKSGSSTKEAVINVDVTKLSNSATITYVGWRSASEGSTYSSKSGFTDITADQTFTVTKNGWYAVCAIDKDDKFGYRLIEVTGLGEGPDLSYSLDPKASEKASTVTVTITAKANSGSLSYVGYIEKVSKDATYSSTSKFTQLKNSPYKFTVDENGWYAICAEDTKNGFSYIVFEITNVGSAAGSDANLKALSYKVGGGAAVAVSNFAAGTASYNVELPAGTAANASVTLTPTLNDSKAKITTNAGVTLAGGAGRATVTVTAENGTTTKTYTVNFTTAAAAVVTKPTTVNGSMGNGKVGEAYSASFTADGTAPLNWSASGLPNGLSINSSTGAISGNPTVDGTFNNITVTATNSAGSASKSFSITIAPADPPPVAQYDFSVSAGAGGSVSGTANGKYDKDTQISVTATPEGGYKFVRWSDGTDTATYSFSLSQDTNLTAEFEEDI